MEKGQSFEIIIRKALSTTDEEVYRFTIFRKIESMDELILHPDVSPLIKERVVRFEPIDNYRFKLFIRKQDSIGP